MRGRLIGAIATAVAVAATTFISGTAAALPATWNVSRDDGGTDPAFTGTAGVTRLVTEGGIELTCDSASAAGTANLGPAVSDPIAQITGTTFTNCTGPFGLTFDVTHVGVWNLAGDGGHASGVTSGHITGIQAQISGPFCEATVTGSVPGTFTNTTNVLAVNLSELGLTLDVDPANDCFGLIADGENAGFEGNFQVSPGLTVVPA